MWKWFGIHLEVKGKTPKGGREVPHLSGNFGFNWKVMTYHRLTHDILAYFIQASWDLLSELVNEQTPLPGHLPRSEVICSEFLDPWDLGLNLLCVLLSNDAQGTMGTLRHSFKGKRNKSMCGRGGGVTEKHRSQSYANSISKLFFLSVCSVCPSCLCELAGIYYGLVP